MTIKLPMHPLTYDHFYNHCNEIPQYLYTTTLLPPLMAFLSDRMGLYLTSDMKAQIERLMSENPDKYESKSHVIRCAVMKLYQEEVINGKREEKGI